MISTRLSLKLRRKVFSSETGGDDTAEAKRIWPSERNLQFDLFAQLSYMSAAATAGISRSQLFEHASKLPYASSRYFREIHVVAQKLNTDYAEACRLVSERTKSQMVRSLLLRMAGSLSSGEEETEFLRREADVIGEAYANQYERDVESLKKWTDAYVTLLVATGLIVIVAVISMMIYQVGVGIIVALSLMMVMATCLGAWIIYASAPREIKTRTSGPSSRLQVLGTRLFKITTPLAIGAFSLTLLADAGLGWALMIAAIFLLPPGVVINRDDRNLTRKDNDVSTLVRVLGGVTSATGTTISEAVSRIDRRSMGALMPEMNRIRLRLSGGIEPALCWNALVDETGSELVDRTIKMFWEPLKLGGDPARVGTAAALFSSRITVLRATRAMVASTFQWLTLPLHVAMVGLLEFIVEIMKLFSATIKSTSGTLGSVSDLPEGLAIGELFTFGQVDLRLLGLLVTVVVLFLTGANAFAPKAAAGGHNYKVAYNLSIVMTISGLLIVLVPIFARAMFSSIVEV